MFHETFFSPDVSFCFTAGSAPSEKLKKWCALGRDGARGVIPDPAL
jgi:hypothetical protein